MAISIGDAVLKLGVDTTKLDQGMKGIGNTIKKHQKAIGLGMTAMGGAILATGVLSVKKFAEMGDEVAKLARKTGFSSETLSELRHAAELSGTSITGLEKATKRMATAIGDAQDGLTETLRDFDKLGISVEDLKGLSPEEAFLKLGQAIADVEDPLVRANVAQGIFGRAGMDLIPMFDEGSEALEEMRKEAHSLGIVFDQEAAKKAEQLTDAMHRMKESTSGVKMAIAEHLIPILMPLIDKITSIIKQITAWAKENPTLFRTIVTVVGVIGALLAVLGPIVMMLPLITAGLPLLGVAFAALLGPVGLVIAAIAALIAIGVLVWKNWDTIKAKAIEIWGSIASFFRGVWERITKIFTEHWDKILAILFPAVGIPILIARNWGKITEVVSIIWNKVLDNVGNILGSLKGVIMDFGKNTLDWLKDKFENIINPIKNTWEWIRNLIGRSPGVVMLGEEMDKLGKELPDTPFQRFYKGALTPTLDITRLLIQVTDNLHGSYLSLRSQVKRLKVELPSLVEIFAGLAHQVWTCAEVVNELIARLSAIPRDVVTTITTIHRDVFVGGGGGGEDFVDPFEWLDWGRLQQGGIAMRPMLASIAEREPEAVIPLSKLERILGGRTANITIYLDRKVLGRALGAPLMDEMIVRTGMRT